MFACTVGHDGMGRERSLNASTKIIVYSKSSINCSEVYGVASLSLVIVTEIASLLLMLAASTTEIGERSTISMPK